MKILKASFPDVQIEYEGEKYDLEFEFQEVFERHDCNFGTMGYVADFIHNRKLLKAGIIVEGDIGHNSDEYLEPDWDSLEIFFLKNKYQSCT